MEISSNFPTLERRQRHQQQFLLRNSYLARRFTAKYHVGFRFYKDNLGQLNEMLVIRSIFIDPVLFKKTKSRLQKPDSQAKGLGGLVPTNLLVDQENEQQQRKVLINYLTIDNTCYMTTTQGEIVQINFTPRESQQEALFDETNIELKIVVTTQNNRLLTCNQQFFCGILFYGENSSLTFYDVNIQKVDELQVSLRNVMIVRRTKKHLFCVGQYGGSCYQNLELSNQQYLFENSKGISLFIQDKLDNCNYTTFSICRVLCSNYQKLPFIFIDQHKQSAYLRQLYVYQNNVFLEFINDDFIEIAYLVLHHWNPHSKRMVAQKAVKITHVTSLDTDLLVVGYQNSFMELYFTGFRCRNYLKAPMCSLQIGTKPINYILLMEEKNLGLVCCVTCRDDNLIYIVQLFPFKKICAIPFRTTKFQLIRQILPLNNQYNSKLILITTKNKYYIINLVAAGTEYFVRPYCELNNEMLFLRLGGQAELTAFEQSRLINMALYGDSYREQALKQIQQIKDDSKLKQDDINQLMDNYRFYIGIFEGKLLNYYGAEKLLANFHYLPTDKNHDYLQKDELLIMFEQEALLKAEYEEQRRRREAEDLLDQKQEDKMEQQSARQLKKWKLPEQPQINFAQVSKAVVGVSNPPPHPQKSTRSKIEFQVRQSSPQQTVLLPASGTVSNQQSLVQTRDKEQRQDQQIENCNQIEEAPRQIRQISYPARQSHGNLIKPNSPLRESGKSSVVSGDVSRKASRQLENRLFTEMLPLVEMNVDSVVANIEQNVVEQNDDNANVGSNFQVTIHHDNCEKQQEADQNISEAQNYIVELIQKSSQTAEVVAKPKSVEFSPENKTDQPEVSLESRHVEVSWLHFDQMMQLEDNQIIQKSWIDSQKVVDFDQNCEIQQESNQKQLPHNDSLDVRSEDYNAQTAQVPQLVSKPFMITQEEIEAELGNMDFNKTTNEESEFKDDTEVKFSFKNGQKRGQFDVSDLNMSGYKYGFGRIDRIPGSAFERATGIRRNFSDNQLILEKRYKTNTMGTGERPEVEWKQVQDYDQLVENLSIGLNNKVYKTTYQVRKDMLSKEKQMELKNQKMTAKTREFENELICDLRQASETQSILGSAQDGQLKNFDENTVKMTLEEQLQQKSYLKRKVLFFEEEVVEVEIFEEDINQIRSDVARIKEFLGKYGENFANFIEDIDLQPGAMLGGPYMMSAVPMAVTNEKMLNDNIEDYGFSFVLAVLPALQGMFTDSCFLMFDPQAFPRRSDAWIEIYEEKHLAPFPMVYFRRIFTEFYTQQFSTDLARKIKDLSIQGVQINFQQIHVYPISFIWAYVLYYSARQIYNFSKVGVDQHENRHFYQLFYPGFEILKKYESDASFLRSKSVNQYFYSRIQYLLFYLRGLTAAVKNYALERARLILKRAMDREDAKLTDGDILRKFHGFCISNRLQNKIQELMIFAQQQQNEIAKYALKFDNRTLKTMLFREENHSSLLFDILDVKNVDYLAKFDRKQCRLMQVNANIQNCVVKSQLGEFLQMEFGYWVNDEYKIHIPCEIINKQDTIIQLVPIQLIYQIALAHESLKPRQFHYAILAEFITFFNMTRSMLIYQLEKILSRLIPNFQQQWYYKMLYDVVLLELNMKTSDDVFMNFNNQRFIIPGEAQTIIENYCIDTFTDLFTRNGIQVPKQKNNYDLIYSLQVQADQEVVNKLDLSRCIKELTMLCNKTESQLVQQIQTYYLQHNIIDLTDVISEKPAGEVQQSKPFLSTYQENYQKKEEDEINHLKQLIQLGRLLSEYQNQYRINADMNVPRSRTSQLQRSQKLTKDQGQVMEDTIQHLNQTVGQYATEAEDIGIYLTAVQNQIEVEQTLQREHFQQERTKPDSLKFLQQSPQRYDLKSAGVKRYLKQEFRSLSVLKNPKWK